MKLVEMLEHHGVIPVMVFDGAQLPEKEKTEENRRSSREINREKGMVFYSEGNHEAATKFFQKCQDITPDMAHKLIQVVP